MCGIFGLVAKPGAASSAADLRRYLHRLALLAQMRGSEAAGVAVANSDSLPLFKVARPAREMVKSAAYLSFIEAALSDAEVRRGIAVIGHSRLVTNGTQGIDENNQPVATEQCVGVHNGIVVNDAELWRQHSHLRRAWQVDTEVLYRLVDDHYSRTQDLADAVAGAYGEIKGEANIAFLHQSERALTLATNVGSLYWMQLDTLGLFMFASEQFFLSSMRQRFFRHGDVAPIHQLLAGHGLSVGVADLAIHHFTLAPSSDRHSYAGARRPTRDMSVKRPALRRCTRCILPHTFPFISFDADGVCNFCREPVPSRGDGRAALEERIAKYRRTDGSRDCIVALSGGRDSCYGLHVLKRELGLNPIAYTYDWAMVTDEARRNCSRVCAELGVEHVIRSADILAKRRNIRVNIEAWLRRPQLGMIPLFMAGDKQFFHYASEVSRQTGIELVIFCGGNNFEVTRFKTGFCGVQDRSMNSMVNLDSLGKIRLLAYYAKNFVLNPAYINRSIFDTLFAFYSTYLGRKDFVYLYRYLEWDEKKIADTLTRYYDWESPDDSASTWRIGDGTAAFYNYIYHTVAGFSEHDTFRSNQLRAGLISREEALARAEQDNVPRYAAMSQYAQLVGFSLDEALVVINNIPKLS
jgi:asparagine synthetase B (glutamine-hydrolysing)